MLAQPERKYDTVDVSAATFRAFSIPSAQRHRSSLVPSLLTNSTNESHLAKFTLCFFSPHKHSKGQNIFPIYSLPLPPSPSIMCEISMKIYIYIFVNFGINQVVSGLLASKLLVPPIEIILKDVEGWHNSRVKRSKQGTNPTICSKKLQHICSAWLLYPNVERSS